MPSPDEILAGLEEITNRWLTVAVVWHLAVAGALIAMSQGWRPSQRVAAGLLSLPVLSVSGFAWGTGNFFNGLVFATLALLMGLIAWRTPRAPAAGQRWATVLGGALIVFAWIYPHFLQGQTPLTYLIAAPLGLIPCPTLSLVIGMSLVGYGPASRWWAITLAIAGGFYALFGSLRLGVWIDLVLLAGSVGLLLLAIRRRQRVAERRHLQLVA